LERDYKKTKQRVEKIALKAAREIDTIVVDGNNLCYEGRTFIGLAALQALMPYLSEYPKVIVVIDSEIRRMLKSDDFSIQKQLGSSVIVHVVAARQKADETVLDLASDNEYSYILSNDTFRDFNEKSVVKDDRIIRHEIIDGNIFVHDLQINVSYRELPW
jgi:hypothetical protein